MARPPCGKEPMHKNDAACHNPKHFHCKEQSPAIRGFLIPCLLFLLKDKPSHGYQLIERLNASGYLKEVPDPGVVYRHLRRLEQENMVTSEFEPGEGPARKVYTLTAEGEAHMKTWIAELKTMNEYLLHFLSDTDR
jgi:PadR family transcriptional regulator, regulatory protein PadR